MSTGISIVIPTFDRPEKLARALRSCFGQSVSPVEIIVVDNGRNPKTQSTTERAQSEGKQCPLRYMKSEPLNLRAALSLGIREAVGEWLILLDDDDFLTPDRIERDLADIASLDPEVVLMVSDFLRVDYNNNVVWTHRMETKALGLSQALVIDDFPPPPAGTWRASAIKAHHPFDVPLGWTDFDLYASLLSFGEVAKTNRFGYIMDDTRVPGRLTTDSEQTLHMVELHRDRYMELRKQTPHEDSWFKDRLDQQQAFYAGKAGGLFALCGPSRRYCYHHPKEFMKGLIAPLRQIVSKWLPDILPEIRGSRTCSLRRLQTEYPQLADLITGNRLPRS